MAKYESQRAEIAVTEQQNRNVAGAMTNESVESVLDELVRNENFDISVSKGYAIGYPDMDKQFKMDYCVTFHGYKDTQWLLKTTSSIRDRIYGTEFFAQNIRIIDKKTRKVEKILVVIPDSLSQAEIDSARRYINKIKSDTYMSFITDIVTTDELRNLISRKCLENIPQGMRSNIVGKGAEKRVAGLLCDEKNWQLWNDFERCKHRIKSDTFSLFGIILTGIGMEQSIGYSASVDQIENIEATDDIPRLKGEGYTKTDVSITISTQFRQNETYNISIKRTEEKRVSVHEGNVTDLISALNIDSNSRLAAALYAFQKYSSVKGVKENAGVVHIDTLERELSNYNHRLVEFALFGVGSPRITNPIQIANCILFISEKLDNDRFWLRRDYVDFYLKTFASKGQFGTPFTWTYSSKKGGVSFQLKGFTSN